MVLTATGRIFTTVRDLWEKPYDAYDLTDEELWRVVKPAARDDLGWRQWVVLVLLEYPASKQAIIECFRGYIEDEIEDLQEEYFLELECRDRDELHLSFFPQPSAAWQVYQPEITSGGFTPIKIPEII